MSTPSPHSKYFERARKGGQARAKRYEQLKTAVTEILTLKTPAQGWARYITAARIITTELETNHDHAIEASGLKRENLLDTVVRWLKADTEGRFGFRLKDEPAHQP
ncbi:hypothetical protein [Rhodoferax sp. BAB1]|uniref:hypothetical protein n=1 Tax=Rhodoferax sp. BAB1 TaxID=2741720 RepID=UPI001575A0CB|nr:hypothetical protein [Rhodoferax sp. BAB1]QKO20780.1 hypothetical protein HTY51_02235 [Rhodoferax sp. BAB1]